MGMAIEVCRGVIPAPQYRDETCYLSVECDVRGAALSGDAPGALLFGRYGGLFLGLYGGGGMWFFSF